MSKLIWKLDSSDNQEHLVLSSFVKLIENLMSQEKNREIFDLEIIYIKELRIPIETNRVYFGFTRKGWEFSKKDLLAEFENYCKKNIIEIYFRNDI